VKLFKKPKSKFYWYDFMVRGRRCRGSTQETKSVRAVKVASLKLASMMENTDSLPSKPTALGELASRFLAWVDSGRLEEMTKKFYRNGWRLLKATPVAQMRVDGITVDHSEQLKFPGSAANANCALRTLRRMLHKAEEWKMIGHTPKIKMMKEHGRHLRLDDEAESRLLEEAKASTWRRQTLELFRDIVILMRDTGMRNQRELYRMRIEKLDWENRVIFVPDSKTPEGRVIAASPLPEEKVHADAEVVAAEERVREVQERINKCAIRAPIDGTVLQVDARPGESFSTITPRALFKLADASGRRVKPEIDERDLAKITIGQSVIVNAEGLGGERFTGTLKSASDVMGKKSVFIDDPPDKIDRDILEATIALSADAKSLPKGLRVTVQF
jgi:integrase